MKYKALAPKRGTIASTEIAGKLLPGRHEIAGEMMAYEKFQISPGISREHLMLNDLFVGYRNAAERINAAIGADDADAIRAADIELNRYWEAILAAPGESPAERRAIIAFLLSELARLANFGSFENRIIERVNALVDDI